jgi:hypothetical protein
VAVLESSVSGIIEQLESSKIEVAGTRFRSRAFVRSWLMTNANAYIHFMDPHALLNIVAEEAALSAEVLASQTNVTKSGYIGTIAASFKIELPTSIRKYG